MTEQTFSKLLTVNDTGQSGSHQAGIHIPKSEKDLIAFLPRLDSAVKNPDVWLECVDDTGQNWRFRYIHYNNRLHDPEGTRDEYRLTHMTGFLRAAGAIAGDVLSIAGEPGSGRLRLKIIRANEAIEEPRRVRLRGWHRVC